MFEDLVAILDDVISLRWLTQNRASQGDLKGDITNQLFSAVSTASR